MHTHTLTHIHSLTLQTHLPTSNVLVIVCDIFTEPYLCTAKRRNGSARILRNTRADRDIDCDICSPSLLPVSTLACRRVSLIRSHHINTHIRINRVNRNKNETMTLQATDVGHIEMPNNALAGQQ